MAVPTPFHNPLIPLSALTAATSFQNPPVAVLVLLPIPIPPETAPDVELFIELNKPPTPILEDPPRATPGPSRRTNTPPPPPPGMGSPHMPAHLEGFKHPLGGRSAFAFALGFTLGFAGGDGEGRRAETSIPPPGFVNGIEMDDEWVQTRGCCGFILVPAPEYVVWQQSAAAAAAAAALGLFIAIGAEGGIGPEAGAKDGCKWGGTV